jgi:hypothetical protein
MIRRLDNCIRTDREGQTLAVVAVMMIAILAVMAIAIDLGLAYTARVEAQRAADAGALAGASVFMEYPLPADYRTEIQRRAREYAAYNFVRNVAVASGFTAGAPVVETENNEVRVQIIDEERKVRVWVRREGIATWFARFIGMDHIAVAAMAAAAVRDAGVAECVKPWVVMDAFLRNEEEDGTLVPANTEGWDPDRHWYEPSRVECDLATTGYGSNTDRESVRPCDWGRSITLHSGDPSDAPLPGFFWPVQLGNGPGADVYRDDIASCSETPIALGDTLRTERGNMPGPTRQGVGSLIGDDQTTWNDVLEGNGADSPRFVTIALVSPSDIAGMDPSDKWVTVTNFGRFFIEGIVGSGPNQTLHGRFLYYVDGSDGGSVQSSLIQMLRLVE